MPGSTGTLVGGGAETIAGPYSPPIAAPSRPWLHLIPADVEVQHDRDAARRRKELACRALNIVAAVFGLLLALPLMLVIAAAVKATSRGPVLYRQPRVGLDRRNRAINPGLAERRNRDRGGRIFTIYKFRTMTDRPMAEADQVWASVDDPRITSVGRVLRKYRLDEIPQLWNVLRGDMNIVGPRPEQPNIFDELRQHLQEYPLRQRVLPGITGWAQVNQSYDQSLEDVRHKVRLDLEYIERRSASEDLRIMARTVPVILLKRGAL